MRTYVRVFFRDWMPNMTSRPDSSNASRERPECKLKFLDSIQPNLQAKQLGHATLMAPSTTSPAHGMPSLMPGHSGQQGCKAHTPQLLRDGHVMAVTNCSINTLKFHWLGGVSLGHDCHDPQFLVLTTLTVHVEKSWGAPGPNPLLVLNGHSPPRMLNDTYLRC